MANNNKNSTKKMSFWEAVKTSFTSPEGKKIFPWFQSGLILIGFALGALVTSGVDVISRLDFGDEDETAEVSEADECRDQGGRYDEDNNNCVLVTSDRGNSCTKNDDCSGWCLADSDAEIGSEDEGYCSENFGPEGCFKFMDEGRVNEICMP
jgi:hypothetical protein